MILYTCPAKTMAAGMHPCARAAKALDDAGYEYELRTVRGFKALPLTRMGDARAEVERLSGQRDVPIVVLQDGEVISGHREIVDWARAHPASAPAAG